MSNLDRVRVSIAPAILAWCAARLAAGRPEFHVDELRRHVAEALPTAPDSAGRVMRDLRARRELDYVVVSRRASLYRLTAVDAPPPGPPVLIVGPGHVDGMRTLTAAECEAEGIHCDATPVYMVRVYESPRFDDAGQALMWGDRA